jgi:aspartyl-tRNA(Asn)/glutamyl-tRNA(Gln) amidotransferase subunit C
MDKLSKETIKYLAELARIKLKEQEENSLLKDLTKIINYFNELQTLDTFNVLPVNGGTNNLNVFREDEVKDTYKNQGKESFPKTKNGFLEIPSVF